MAKKAHKKGDCGQQVVSPKGSMQQRWALLVVLATARALSGFWWRNTTCDSKSSMKHKLRQRISPDEDEWCERIRKSTSSKLNIGSKTGGPDLRFERLQVWLWCWESPMNWHRHWSWKGLKLKKSMGLRHCLWRSQLKANTWPKLNIKICGLGFKVRLWYHVKFEKIKILYF